MAALPMTIMAEKKSLSPFRHVTCNNYPSEPNAKFLYHLATISLSLASILRPLFKYLNCYPLRHCRNKINFCGLLKSSDY